VTIIEELTFDGTFLSREDVDHVGSFRNLKSLSLNEPGLHAADLQGLRKHPSLERLAIRDANSDKELIEIFQGMPHLREISLGITDEHPNPSLGDLERTLKQAMPRCIFRISDDRR
jgi:hypothetical protein